MIKKIKLMMFHWLKLVKNVISDIIDAVYYPKRDP